MSEETDFFAGLTERDDAPALTSPKEADWTENYWWIAHDGGTGMGLMAHVSTSRHDLSVVRQTVVVFLPDGRSATDISFGGFREAGVIRGATLWMKCVTPFREWRISNNGIAQISTLAESWHNTPRPGPRVPLRFDIKAECIGPVWTAHGGNVSEQMDRQEWASSHYQQTIRLRGVIDLDGVRHDFNGTGIRDHSRGPRNVSNWHSHVLASAPFSGGRSFGIMSVAGSGGAAVYQSAYIVRDGVIERGIPRSLPSPMSRNVLQPESTTIEIDIGGQIETIAVQTHSRALLTMLVPYDVTPGLYRDRPGCIGLSEAMATFTWDGEVGYGNLERSVLIEALPQ